MIDDAPEDYRNREIYDATGALLGTVADVGTRDGEEVLYVNPDPEVPEESWAAIGDDTLVNFDNNWLGIADYKVWDAESGEDAEFDEWPYTLSTEYVDEVDGGEIHLKY